MRMEGKCLRAALKRRGRLAVAKCAGAPKAEYLCFNAFMRTTIDLSDDLFRRAKAEAALRGRKLKDLVEDGLRRVLDQPDSPVAAPPPATLHDLMQDCCGVAEPTPPDYSVNPAHLDGFGS